MPMLIIGRIEPLRMQKGGALMESYSDPAGVGIGANMTPSANCTKNPKRNGA
jgi:hypothetical protein